MFDLVLLCNLIYLYFDLYSDILRAAELFIIIFIIIIYFIFIHIFPLRINYYIFGDWCTRYQNLSLVIISTRHPLGGIMCYSY